MKLLADLNIAPRTVQALRSEGLDVTRVNELLPPSTPDAEIVRYARANGFTVVTQDLDFVSGDDRQLALAKASGFDVVDVKKARRR